jgi:hypothetical protein
MRICRSHFHEHHRWMIAHQFHLFHTHCCLLTHLMITQSRCLASLILHFPLVNLCHLKMLKKTPLWKDIQGAIYTSREWSHIINNSDPLSGLSFPSMHHRISTWPSGTINHLGQMQCTLTGQLKPVFLFLFSLLSNISLSMFKFISVLLALSNGHAIYTYHLLSHV